MERINNRSKGTKKGVLGGKDPLEWDQAKAICRVTAAKGGENKKLALAFCIQLFTGLRIHEVLHTTKSDLIKREIQVQSSKTKKISTVPLGKGFYKLIKECGIRVNDLVPPLFGTKKNPKIPLKVNYVSKQFKKCSTLVPGLQHLDLGTHSLRKAFGKRFYDKSPDKGNALIELGIIFRHSDPSITRIYIGVTKHDIKESIISLDDD